MRPVKPRWARFAFPARPRRRNERGTPHPDGLRRCTWPGQDPLYVAYHDRMGVPEYDDRALYDEARARRLSRPGCRGSSSAQADKLPRAFDGFNPVKMRATRRKVERLMRDTGIVRNRMKMTARALRRAYLDVMEKGRVLEPAVGFPRRRPRFNRLAQHQPGAGGDRSSRKKISKEVAAALSPHHRLRLHAGGRMVNDICQMPPPLRPAPQFHRASANSHGLAMVVVKASAAMRSLGKRRSEH